MAFHDLLIPTTGLLDPTHQFAGVATVRPDQRQTRIATFDSLEHQLGSITILNPGRVNDNAKDQSHDNNDEIALAPADLLACVITVDPTMLVGLGRLALSMIAAVGSD